MKKNVFFIVMVLMVTGPVLWAQNVQPDYKKLHYLSKEEMNKPLEHLRSFTPTDPPEGVIRNVAEFDPMQGVLVRYPFGVPVELIREMAEETPVTTIVANASEQQTVINTYTAHNVNLDNCNYLIAPSDSYWVRDYGPWFVFDGNKNPGIVDFPYNRPRPNDNNIPAKVAQELGIDLYGMNLISTGGNYMCDGMGMAASTDLVWEENPSLSTIQVSDYVEDYLGNSPYLVTEDPLGDYIKHIDCWGKYLSPGKVIIGQVPESDSRYQDYEDIANYFANTNSAWGYPYEVVRVFTPGTDPNTPYSNSLILNDKVMVPITGSQWDDEALAVYEAAMPGYEIVGIMYDGWENTDALHCRTRGIADVGMLYINHIPLLGEIYYADHYDLTAEVIAYSGANIYQDSVYIYYQINQGDYQIASMTLVSGDQYTGTIEGVAQGDSVAYYLFAADESGRRSFSPSIGQPDPFTFQVAILPGLTFNPDSVLFETSDDMVIGLPLSIINHSSSGIMISSITELGDEFAWFVDEMPQLPLFLPANDSFSLTIKCDQVTKYMGMMLTDSLYVTTGSGVFAERIIIDSDLILSIDPNTTLPQLSLFPNPASTYINIAMADSFAGVDAVQVVIYTLSGNQVFNHILNVDSPNLTMQLPYEMPSGTYVYQVITGNEKTTGRLVVIK